MKIIISLIVIVCLSFICSKPNSIISKNIIDEAKRFVNTQKLDSTQFVFIDMRKHSGKKRLFVYDFQNDSIKISGLVSHGCCDLPWSSDESKDNPTFSNEEGSHCSSLGKFVIGARGYSSWGIKVNYKLYGFENQNSNALDRLIVLHSWDAMTDYEIYPKGSPEGWGCPAVSNNVMQELDQILKNNSNRILLWIYQ